MAKRIRSQHPEIYADFNGRFTENGYLPVHGTDLSLAKLGLKRETALGRPFVFVMDNEDANGNPDDLMCNGTFVRDEAYGILLEADGTGFYWRSELTDG